MLVLSRKVGEKLVIGNDITVEIIRIAGNRITLGLAAPADVKILRSELQPTAAAVSSGKEVAQSAPFLHAS